MGGKRKPFIGVTPWYDYDKRITYIKPGYCEGITAAGGIPLLLPLVSEAEVLEELLAKMDGILISGGPDVDGVHFGEHNLPWGGEISPYRDAMELYLAKRFIDENKPVFGICRGLQVMNVAMGGTLYQDIYSQQKGKELLKHSQDAPKWYPTHDIAIEEGSKVAAALGMLQVKVNSFHHQAVKEVAPGFAVTSRSPDGIIEALEYEGRTFAVGVQWHPELMWEQNHVFLHLFRDFVNCC